MEDGVRRSTRIKKAASRTPIKPIKLTLKNNGKGVYTTKKSPKKRAIDEAANENIWSSDVSEDDQFNSSNEFQPQSDYFQAISQTVKKSGNTLKKIDMSLLSSSNASKLTEKDQADREAVINGYANSLFPEVYGLLTAKFSVILYGVGSKKNLLDKFKEQWLADEKFLKIYGYFLELNLRTILIKLSKLFGIEETTNECDFFKQAAELKDDLFLVIHSMDILFKTDAKIKRFLTKLNAECGGKLHIVGTVDSINSALMFDLKEAQKLNLVHLEATTYESYHLEIGFLRSGSKNKKGMLDLQGQTLTLTGILTIYNALPEHTKHVLLLIFREWLEHRELNRNIGKKSGIQEEDDVKGLELKTVAQKAREQFLANSGMLLIGRLL